MLKRRGVAQGVGVRRYLGGGILAVLLNGRFNDLGARRAA